MRIDALQFSIKGIGYSVEDSYSSLTDRRLPGVNVVVGRKETVLSCEGNADVSEEFEMISQELDRSTE